MSVKSQSPYGVQVASWLTCSTTTEKKKKTTARLTQGIYCLGNEPHTEKPKPSLNLQECLVSLCVSESARTRGVRVSPGTLGDGHNSHASLNDVLLPRLAL